MAFYLTMIIWTGVIGLVITIIAAVRNARARKARLSDERIAALAASYKKVHQ